MKSETSKGLRLALLVYAIWWALYGLLHIFAPDLMMARDPAIERVLGAAVVAFAIAAVLAYGEKAWARARIAILLQVVWMGLYVLTMGWGILAGAIAAEAWIPTVIGLVFAILLAILYAREAAGNT
jgi:hypothetical protein